MNPPSCVVGCVETLPLVGSGSAAREVSIISNAKQSENAINVRLRNFIDPPIVFNLPAWLPVPYSQKHISDPPPEPPFPYQTNTHQTPAPPAPSGKTAYPPHPPPPPWHCDASGLSRCSNKSQQPLSPAYHPDPRSYYAHRA